MTAEQMPPAGPVFKMAVSGRRKVRMLMRRNNPGFFPNARKFAQRTGALSLALLSILGLSGCHSSWPFDGSTVLLDSAQFMTAWNTYLHCRSSEDPEDIRADLQQLNRVAHAVSAPNHASVLLLPAAVRTLIATLPSRLAVDPQAMSAACALHGSHVAQIAGRPDLSVEWLTGVAAHEGWASTYSAVRAGSQLKRME